jgi:NADH:ubiquinone oxidoreductase subunit 2 (subunit N)
LMLLLILFINLISLYYYIKIVKIIWFENLNDVNKKWLTYRIINNFTLKVVFILTSLFNIFFLYFNDIYTSLINNIFFNMFTNIY